MREREREREVVRMTPRFLTQATGKDAVVVISEMQKDARREGTLGRGGNQELVLDMR